MSPTVHYGFDARIDLELAPAALVAHCAPPPASGHDALALVREALRRPQGYPALAEAVVPGDKVVLALEPSVPECDSIIAAVVACLVERGARAEDVTVLRTRAEAEAGALDPRRMLAPELRAQVRLEDHDPDERDRLGYLANTAKGRPIYLNRSLCDADLVVSIGVLRVDETPAYHGVHGALYPTFSDARTQQRFRHPGLIERDEELVARAHREVDRVGWLAGTPFVIQALPGADDTLLGVYCGAAEAAARAGAAACRTAWRHTVPARASLVIAAVSGDASQQTWDNVGRALAAALPIVADDGVIALCTELSAPPGPGVQALVDVEQPHQALRRAQRRRPSDLLPATELATALEHGRVYLLSRLEESVVEELGMAAVTDPSDLARLARRHPSCIVLSDAQYTRATVAGES